MLGKVCICLETVCNLYCLADCISISFPLGNISIFLEGNCCFPQPNQIGLVECSRVLGHSGRHTREKGNIREARWQLRFQFQLF